MYKTALTTIAALATASTAFASTLLPPPTEVYVEPVRLECEATTVQIYFENGGTLLTAPARRTIAATKQQLTGCAIADLDMKAIAADGRTMPETTSLASERIATVLSALTDEGLVADNMMASIDTDIAESQIGRTMARRVDVTFAAYDPSIG